MNTTILLVKYSFLLVILLVTFNQKFQLSDFLYIKPYSDRASYLHVHYARVKITAKENFILLSCF